MKKLLSSLFFLLAASFLLFSISCQKKWKRPTSVSFSIKLNTTNTNNSQVEFTNVYLVLNKLSIKGERSQGAKEVELEKPFTENKILIFSENESDAGIKFDVPQGTYSNVQIKLAINTDQDGNSLKVNGTYSHSPFKKYPVQFIFSAADLIAMMATNASGGNSISLMEDHPAIVTVVMDPDSWFASVSRNMMEKAHFENVGGVPTILISEDENKNIYSLIVSHMKDGNKVTFN